MRVAFFFGALNRGGAETLVYDVCKKKELAPYEIVCLYRKDGEYIDAYRDTGVKMVKLEQKGGPLRLLSSLRKTVLNNGIDIIHAQTGFNALLCVFALLFTQVKLVTTFHGFSFASSTWLQRKLVYWKSKKLICVSDYERQYYLNKWDVPNRNKFCVVYNGIDFSKLDDPVPSNDDLVKVSKDCLNMIMVGSFRSGRSQSFVCKVAESLKEKGVAFRLFFVGRKEPSEPHRYDRCVEYCISHGLTDSVSFLGNRSDIPSLLRQMDLFIYASEHDTFGIAVLEAMASALPVVVNDWIVMKEITENGRFAALYKTDNLEDCVLKILECRQKLLDDKEAFKVETDRIKETVRTKFSIENHIKELYSVYSSCLS